MREQSMIGIRASLSWCILLSLSQFAMSAPDLGSIGRQGESTQQQQQQQLQLDREGALRQAPPNGINLDLVAPTVPSNTSHGNCSTVNHIEVRNSPHLSGTARQKIQDQYAGKCLGGSEISQIMGLVTKDYMAHGFIAARAYLPAQDLKAGTLVIDVNEGRIEAFKFDDECKSCISVRNVFPAQVGEPLSLRDLEQGIEQINRLPSNEAKLEILPGSSEGDSIVAVHNKPTSPIGLSLSFDNQGLASTGRNEGTAIVSLDGLLGFSDQITYIHRETLPNEQNGHYSLMDDVHLSIPDGYNSYSLDINQSSYVNQLTLPSGLVEAA